MDGTRGLTLAELTRNASTPPISYPAEDIMKTVLRSELAAGRIRRLAGGRYQLLEDRWDPGQLNALRELALDP